VRKTKAIGTRFFRHKTRTSQPRSDLQKNVVRGKAGRQSDRHERRGLPGESGKYNEAGQAKSGGLISSREVSNEATGSISVSPRGIWIRREGVQEGVFKEINQKVISDRSLGGGEPATSRAGEGKVSFGV